MHRTRDRGQENKRTFSVGILRVRAGKERCLEMVNKQPSRLTATLSLQPVQDAVINSVGETGEIKVLHLVASMC